MGRQGPERRLESVGDVGCEPLTGAADEVAALEVADRGCFGLHLEPDVDRCAEAVDLGSLHGPVGMVNRQHFGAVAHDLSSYRRRDGLKPACLAHGDAASGQPAGCRLQPLTLGDVCHH